MATFQVLLIDDEHDFVDSLVKRLRRRGIACEGAYTGEEALRRLAASRFDVVLLDMMLPDADGNTVLKAIREIDRTLPVVVLTGHASIAAGEESVQLGAVDYLLKPVELETLFERLAAAVAGRREKDGKGSPQGVDVSKFQQRINDQGGKLREKNIATVL